MIVAFEGLSCAGKSAVTSALFAKNNSLYRHIPEFIVDISSGVTTELCMANDVAKATYAELIDGIDVCVLLDRSHLSTLVYVYAESPEKHREVKAWYDAAIRCQRIAQPEMTIYLRVKPQTSLDRAAHTGRLNEAYAWYSHAQEAYDKYNDYLLGSGVSENCIVIDCDDMPFDKLVASVEDAIMTKIRGRES